jgi:hypothetical protein
MPDRGAPPLTREPPRASFQAGSGYLVLQRQAGCVLHISPATCPGAHVAISPGRHVMLHAAQVPTAGTLHDAPVSGFFFV